MRRIPIVLALLPLPACVTRALWTPDPIVSSSELHRAEFAVEALGLCVEQPAAPQQSESSRQISPVGWQPLGGWQIRTPVGPYGRHARLQHSPPQIGSALPS